MQHNCNICGSEMKEYLGLFTREGEGESYCPSSDCKKKESSAESDIMRFYFSTGSLVHKNLRDHEFVPDNFGWDLDKVLLAHYDLYVEFHKDDIVYQNNNNRCVVRCGAKIIKIGHVSDIFLMMEGPDGNMCPVITRDSGYTGSPKDFPGIICLSISGSYYLYHRDRHLYGKRGQNGRWCRY